MRIFSRIKKEKVLYTLYTADIPTTTGTSIFTFADDTTIMATHEDPKIAHNMLQQLSKCNHIIFTFKKGTLPPVTLNNVSIRRTKTVKYLGLHMNERMTWEHHIKAKIEQIRIKRRIKVKCTSLLAETAC